MKIAVVGMGLIGGSLLKASEKAGFETVGLHHGDTTPLSDVDILFIALPPTSIGAWIDAHEATFKPGLIAVDVCGVKTPIFNQFREKMMKANWTFIPGHPMAGKEHPGFANADPDLFVGASMILTPYPYMGRGPLDTLTPVLKALGFARIVSTTPDHHDQMIAYTSQLCHVLSSVYAQEPLISEAKGYTAGSFKDMTRIASMDPETWSDLFLENRKHLMEVTGRYIAKLQELNDDLTRGDREGLKRWIQRGAELKKEFAE